MALSVGLQFRSGVVMMMSAALWVAPAAQSGAI